MNSKHILTNKINQLVEKTKSDSRILAVYLFGSILTENFNDKSDTDVCLVLAPQASHTPYHSAKLSEIKLHYLKNFELDIQIFQQIPIYIRKRVLKEGRLLYCKDEDKLYELASRHIREYADFEHIYRDFLETVKYG